MEEGKAVNSMQTVPEGPLMLQKMETFFVPGPDVIICYIQRVPEGTIFEGLLSAFKPNLIYVVQGQTNKGRQRL